MNDNIFVFGSSGHAKVIIDIIENEKKYKITGLIDKEEFINKKTFQYEVLGSEKQLGKLIKKYNTRKGIIAIGDNSIRKKVAENILKNFPEFEFVNAVHPTVLLGKNVSLGKGIVIMPNVTINADSTIEDHCIINTRAVIEHDNHLASFCSLAPGTITGGNVKIGQGTAVGLGTIILPTIEIGENSIIGAGSLVLKDIPSNVVAFGLPAKTIKDNFQK
jgi:sugar O-acyltransferase (sialic acid O-acetyltransferase NeuD family)